MLSSYQVERYIMRSQDSGPNRLKKGVKLDREFVAFWDRIKPRTTYRVEFDTDLLVNNAVQAVSRMQPMARPVIDFQTAGLRIDQRGVDSTLVRVTRELAGGYDAHPVPDLLAYLQNETELTRSTLVRILTGSGRLDEFFNDPQRFMDEVARQIKHVLHALLVDGIKYERVDPAAPDSEWEMLRFQDEELINYLTALQVDHSVYEYVVYDSEVERRFAQKLDARDDVKLFVKLPRWFTIDTPVGKYNPDWAILKTEGPVLCMVRETKDVRQASDFLQLRTSESDKVRCGIAHFKAVDVSFDVISDASQV